MPAWEYAQTGGRAGAGRVIVEGFIDFDYEITLLTVRHAGGTAFCDADRAPAERRRLPRELAAAADVGAGAAASQDIARAITDDLGGWGVFGVELFVKGDEVWFSEVSPRPHDTGLVTLVSQDLSEFALHARAILGPADPARSATAIGPVGILRDAGRKATACRCSPTSTAALAGTRLGAAPVRQAARGRPAPRRRDPGARRRHRRGTRKPRARPREAITIELR